MKKIASLIVITITFFTSFYAQNTNQKSIDANKKAFNINDFIKISGKAFVTYRYNVNRVEESGTEISRDEDNQFSLKRGYFTLKKDLNKTFSIRYTSDLTIDREGSDAGNVEVRMKYLYVRAKPELGIDALTGTWIEAGMVHCPWTFYEQNINPYRVQGNMAILRDRIFTSADLGVTIGGNIGPKMDKKFLKEVNGAMKGKWLSYAFGLYNGGGYHTVERNKNKTFALRLSARPLANILPELQVSGHFNTGKGNSEHSPDMNQFVIFMAYTGRHFTATAQHHFGEGDFMGRYVNEDNPSEALKSNGYSFFGEYKIHKTPFAIWGRYDHFTVDRITSNDVTERMMGGLTYNVNKNIRFVLNAEHNQRGNKKNEIYELNCEVTF